MGINWISLVLLLSVQSASADSELREVYRTTRMMGMGGTGVGLVNDVDALYINPAGLAGNETFGLHYGGLEFTASYDTYTALPTMVGIASELSGEAINKLLGKNIYGRFQYTPTLLMKNMAIGLYLDGQTAFYARDRVFPQVTYGFQTTFGIQAGYGYTVAHLFKKKGEVRVGLAAKWLYRRGGYRPISISKLMAFTARTYKDEAGIYGRGLGADGGLQYHHTFSKKLSATVGGAYQDMGDTNFGSDPQANRGNLSVGASLKYTVSKFTATSAVDIRHLRAPTDWRKRTHLGLELGMPYLFFWGGINQVSLTYGGAIDLWFARLSVATYTEELGTFVFQDPNQRYVLRIDMKVNL